MPLTRVATPRRLTALLVAPLLLLPLVLATPAAAVSPDLVISQVYGGGGNSGATYTHDFIEIYNRGTAPASLNGMSLQYASATGTGSFGANASQLTELPDVSVPAGRYFLVQEASTAPVGSPLPAPDLVDPTPIAMAAGAGKVALVTGTATLGCNGGSTPCSATALSRIRDLVGYGNANFFEGAGAAPTLSNTTAALRAGNGATDTDNNSADFTAGPPNPRTSGTTPPPPPVPTCDESGVTPVSDVQGSGSSTPLPGQTVLVEAVLTANRPGLSGFFLQEEDGDVDSDAQTSEGIFVSGSLPGGAAAGDVVRVRGTATESFGQTRISATGSIECGGDTAPAPTAVTFPVASTSFLERYEGMLVTFPQDLVISEYFNYDRFGETVVGLPKDGLSRFFTPTAVTSPGAAANALAAEYALRRITLDDGRNAQNPSPTYFPGTVDDEFTLENRFRGGDTLSDITGVLDFSFGLYRVHPTSDATYRSVNQRPEQPPAVGGDVKVASFNVLNYFLTLDDGTNDICGGNQDLECRGADDANELQRQRAKILDAIARLDADVVGLIEMENTPGVEPAADLAAGLNDLLGPGTYDFVDTGVIGTDAIRVGFLYQPATVMPIGTHHVLDSSVDPRFLDEKNRPALAQTFKKVESDHRFTVAVNHFKSKGSDCNDVGDPDLGDGQGNCNVTRTAAATALADWLQQPQIGKGDPDRLIIGDLNAYDHEDPIDALKAAGYRDLVEKFGGEFAYGFVFDGQVGYLDHALANASMVGQVTGAAEWHINADEPDILDYDTSFKRDAEDALYEPNAFRSSDHDAVLVGLDLTGNSRNG